MKHLPLNNLVLVFLVVILSSACKSKSAATNEDKAKNLSFLENLKSQSDYRIDIEVIYPFNSLATTQVANALLRNTGNNAARIDVQGDGNYLEIKNDSVKAYLPFFGESRQSGGSYGGTDIAIQLDEELTNLEKNIDPKKGILELMFNATQAKGDKDKYDIKVSIFDNNRASVEISPVFRTFIRYDGNLAELKE